MFKELNKQLIETKEKLRTKNRLEVALSERTLRLENQSRIAVGD